MLDCSQAVCLFLCYSIALSLLIRSFVKFRNNLVQDLYHSMFKTMSHISFVTSCGKTASQSISLNISFSLSLVYPVVVPFRKCILGCVLPQEGIVRRVCSPKGPKLHFLIGICHYACHRCHQEKTFQKWCH